MSDSGRSSSSTSKGKQPVMPPPPPPSANLSSMPPPPPLPDNYRESEEVHSRASDAGSVSGDSQSDARSTATMDTSMSAGTLASGASTAFYSQQVHFFSLDDFAGHEIQTILEDGEQPESTATPKTAWSYTKTSVKSTAGRVVPYSLRLTG